MFNRRCFKHLKHGDVDPMVLQAHQHQIRQVTIAYNCRCHLIHEHLMKQRKGWFARFVADGFMFSWIFTAGRAPHSGTEAQGAQPGCGIRRTGPYPQNSGAIDHEGQYTTCTFICLGQWLGVGVLKRMCVLFAILNYLEHQNNHSRVGATLFQHSCFGPLMSLERC